MRLATVLVLAAALACAGTARADLSPEQLAKIAQNPLANVVSVPVQYNGNFGTGPEDGRLDVLNLQPVVPVELNADWNLLTRTVIPFFRQPGFVPGQGSTSGIGDVQFSSFLSPERPGAGGMIWGVGTIVQAPTDQHGLGNKNWGLGPTFAVLRLQQGNPWVTGVLVNNVSSLSSDRQGGHYNNFLLEPILSYNLPDGTYIHSVPLITANWDAQRGQKWTVPAGMGVGHIFHVGPAPVNTLIGAYYNVVRPKEGPRWQLRLQVQLMFPR